MAKDELVLGWEDAEKDYLLGLLGQVQFSPLISAKEPSRLSPKVEQLICMLLEDYTANFSGLIFVKQRATVAALCHLLSVHPRTRDIFTCGTFIGSSTNVARKVNLGELSDTKTQMNTLDDFRRGSKNLMIATNALEEGIDVSSCHLVICFSKPDNLKSFIQRRGRARKQQSTYALMVAADDISDELSDWQTLEKEMIRMYQNETRTLEETSAVEEETSDARRLEVESTGYVCQIPRENSSVLKRLAPLTSFPRQSSILPTINF